MTSDEREAQVLREGNWQACTKAYAQELEQAMQEIERLKAVLAELTPGEEITGAEALRALKDMLRLEAERDEARAEIMRLKSELKRTRTNLYAALQCARTAVDRIDDLVS